MSYYERLSQHSQPNAKQYAYLHSLKMQGFEPKVVYDIGACVAEFPKTVKLVWPYAKCILFEAFDKLEPLYKQLPYDYHIGVLSDEDDKCVTFWQNDTMISGNSYYREVGYHVNYYPDETGCKKYTQKLDSIVRARGFPLPDLVKIDVQGAEKDVIQGGLDTIKHAQHMIVEMQHTEYNQGAPKVDTTLPWIETHGWKCVAPLFSNNGPDGDYGFVNKNSLYVQNFS